MISAVGDQARTKVISPLYFRLNHLIQEVKPIYSYYITGLNDLTNETGLGRTEEQLRLKNTYSWSWDFDRI